MNTITNANNSCHPFFSHVTSMSFYRRYQFHQFIHFQNAPSCQDFEAGLFLWNKYSLDQDLVGNISTFSPSWSLYQQFYVLIKYVVVHIRSNILYLASKLCFCCLGSCFFRDRSRSFISAADKLMMGSLSTLGVLTVDWMTAGSGSGSGCRTGSGIGSGSTCNQERWQMYGCVAVKTSNETVPCSFYLMSFFQFS